MRLFFASKARFINENSKNPHKAHFSKEIYSEDDCSDKTN